VSASILFISKKSYGAIKENVTEQEEKSLLRRVKRLESLPRSNIVHPIMTKPGTSPGFSQGKGQHDRQLPIKNSEDISEKRGIHGDIKRKRGNVLIWFWVLG